MKRTDTTDFLRNLLIADRLTGVGKYWASEVSVDPWKKGGKRVDFMQFVPPDQCSPSSIEKGIFVCYEVKSCVADIYSGNGLNFLGEKNFLVTTMECYKKLDIGELQTYIKGRDNYKDSSVKFGVMVACPDTKELADEYENPTPLPEDGNGTGWRLKILLPSHSDYRNRSMTELLFCMLRSGKEITE